MSGETTKADFFDQNPEANTLTLKNSLTAFRDIKAFIFDVDGVLTDGRILVTEEGNFLRTFHSRDGYAIRRALEEGYFVCIITGGRGKSIEIRMQKLGIQHYFVAADPKLPIFMRYLDAHDLALNQVLFMGDDLNDYEVMKKTGLACCPSDAASEIITLSHYISPFKGGEGCVRDVIERVMRVQGCWLNNISVSG
jgi:3-deoxy-D-manno-octulosonate 8-phosphate phosphatase (KDO 8-P phosphatase)